MKYLFVGHFVLICCLFNLNAYSQWISANGPDCGTVNVFASSGSTIFAGTEFGGVFVSSDHGATWSSSNSGLTNLSITSFTVAGSNLYVGTPAGLFISKDNGTSWNSTGMGSQSILSLVSSGTEVYAGTFLGVYYSNDNGVSWTPKNSGLVNPLVMALAFSGSNLFAGTEGGLFVSSDKGSSWTYVNTNINGDVAELSASGSNLFAASYNGLVARSTDNGATWTVLSHNFNLSIDALAVSGTNVFVGLPGGGVWFSYDNGDSWTHSIPDVTPGNYGISSLSFIGDKVFQGTGGGGIYISSDTGLTWTASNNGLINADVLAMAVLNNLVFAGTGGAGVFVSKDNGASWVAANNNMQANYITSFATIGTDLFAGSLGAGVWHSGDNGGSWEWMNNFLTSQSVSALAVNGNNLFAGTLGGGVFIANHVGSSWTGADTGWSPMNTGLSNLVVKCLAVNGNNLYAGTDGGGIFHSTNNGASWTAINTGLTGLTINSLTAIGSNLFASVNDESLFMLDKSGTSWKRASHGLDPFVYSLFASGNNLFAGTSSGVYFSTNSGTSWNNEGLDYPGSQVNTLLVNSGRIIAGTSDGIYYQSLSDFPEIIKITPASGPIGASITITGANFSSTPSGNTVTFNGTPATVTSATNTSLTVIVPVGATNGPVKVSVGSQSITSDTTFVVNCLNQPIALAGSAISATGFTATWNSIPGAASYRLDVSTDNFSTFLPNYNSAQVADTSKIVAGLNPNTVYQYRVMAYSVSCGSVYSNVISVTTNKLDQTITFGSLTALDYDGTYNLILGATASSGLVVRYSSSNTGVAMVTGDSITIVGAGSTTITASQLGSSSYNAALSVDQLLVVNKGHQTIVFDSIPVLPDSTGFIDLNTYASVISGLPLNFSSSDTSVVKISGNIATTINTGTAIIAAWQQGNQNYSAAHNVNRILKVMRGQTITFDSIQPLPVTHGSVDLNSYASVNSGLPLTFTSSNPAVAIVSGNLLNVVGVGKAMITATQHGDDTFAPAVAQQSLAVFSKTINYSVASAKSDTLAFGVVVIGFNKILKLTVTNTGDSSLKISNIAYPNEYSGDQTNAVIPSGGTLDISINFTPTNVNQTVDSIVFTSDATSGGGKFYVTGEGQKVTGIEKAPPPFSVYPNPSSGVFFVEGINPADLDQVAIRVMDPLGRILNVNYSIEQTRLSVDLTAFSSGLYFILVPERAVRVIKK